MMRAAGRLMDPPALQGMDCLTDQTGATEPKGKWNTNQAAVRWLLPPDSDRDTFDDSVVPTPAQVNGRCALSPTRAVDKD